MPWLANASAQVQGKSLVEVCTVYGVSLVPLATPGGDGHDAPGSGQASSDHGKEHCALSALPVLAGGDPPALAGAWAAPYAAPPPHPPRAVPTADAVADWAARRKHGPPSIA